MCRLRLNNYVLQETGERLVDLGSDQVGEAKGHFKMMLAQVLNVYPI